MKQEISRSGTFSSSSIWKLMTNDRSQKGIGAKGMEYIQEKKYETKLGRQLSQDKNPRSASWGNLCERYIYLLLSVDYVPTEKGNRKVHPEFTQWTGEEDFTRKDFVGDIKCFELKNFCFTHNIFSTGNLETIKEECPEIFWQLVSGAILCKKKKAELVLYVPYKKELDSIRAEAEESNNPKYSWMKYTTDEELPYLIHGGFYKNISKFEIEIRKEDKEALNNRVQMAIELLKK